MRSPRSIWLWTVVALLLSVLAPSAQAAWRCEGRTCGTTLWFCCCNSPGQDKDQKCSTPATPTAGEKLSACGADCGCTLSVISLDRTRGTRTDFHTAPVYAPALVPPAEQVLSLTLVGGAVLIPETRGPPLRRSCLASARLRGPPCLTFTHIGC